MRHALSILILTLLAVCASALSGHRRHSKRGNDHLDGLAGRSVNALVKKETNAERFARGLPPLPPKFKKHHLPGREPTPVNGVRRSVPSSIPCSGIISVNRADTGEAIGYVSQYYFSASIKRYPFTAVKSNAMQVSFNAYSSPFNILALNPPDPVTYPDLGFGANTGVTVPDLSPTTDAYVVLMGGADTPVNSPPDLVPSGYGRTFESAIWSYNAGQLTVSWVNTDGSHPASHIFYYPPTAAIVLVGNPTNQDVLTRFPGGYEVTFNLISS